ncbi:MAG: methylmalonyl Co-A mutase-associated GTPase MeaB [Sphaerobacteraceae bacterium]|nr:MAG: methylmalonyl Co-A mutase-associated GTPase MeaB [Sphaerobacteraceae bacterium]
MNGLLDRFLDGDRQALARLLSHVENETPLADEAMQELADRTGSAHVIGLTGPPGAGKSTLANEFVRQTRNSGKTIAVLAIDPTSPISGGATLGDRIRMLDMQDDDGVFLRSMASREQTGGLSLAAFGATMILDAFGFDIVLIETVGAGQDEVDIARLADTVMLVQTPGMGDSIQAVKAGILEIADVLVVNKADQPGADETVRTLREHVRQSTTSGWRVPVLAVISSTGQGIEDLISTLEQHQRMTSQQVAFEETRRRQRLHYHARMLAIRELARHIERNQAGNPGWSDPHQLAEEMINAFVQDRTETKPTSSADHPAD